MAEEKGSNLYRPGDNNHLEVFLSLSPCQSWIKYTCDLEKSANHRCILERLRTILSHAHCVRLATKPKRHTKKNRIIPHNNVVKGEALKIGKSDMINLRKF